MWVQALGWENILEEHKQPTPVFLPGESYRQRSRAGCSPYGDKDWTQLKRLSMHTQIDCLKPSSLCLSLL